MITFITPAQGNPKALRRTIDSLKESFAGLVNEFIVGDVSIFDDLDTGFEDVRLIKLRFNELFKKGFAEVLNGLAAHATNHLCIYLNVGERVEKNLNTTLLSDKFNCYAFNHAVDPHKWVRVWDRRDLCWRGVIHEEIFGNRKLCPKMLFQMEDTPKDDDDGVYNDVKEMVYFQQYIRLVEDPAAKAAAHPHWVKYAEQNYTDLTHRLLEKGGRYEAFLEGDKEKYIRLAKEAVLSTEWSKP